MEGIIKYRYVEILIKSLFWEKCKISNDRLGYIIRNYA